MGSRPAANNGGSVERLIQGHSKRQFTSMVAATGHGLSILSSWFEAPLLYRLDGFLVQAKS